MTDDFLNKLFETIESRKKELPENSYVTEMFKKGENKIAQKIGEEASELIIAALKEDRQRTIEESADLLFHLLLLLSAKNISLNEVINELKKRSK